MGHRRLPSHAFLGADGCPAGGPELITFNGWFADVGGPASTSCWYPPTYG